MSIISWNCRGVGHYHDLTIPRLKELRVTYFPEILFWMETMNNINVLVDLKVWLGYDQIFTVDPVNRWGGLALFWKNSVEVDIVYLDKNVIDVHSKMGNKQFFLSCIYGSPHISYRHMLWEHLMGMGVNRKNCWCMIGNFNEIRTTRKRLVEVCGMSDLEEVINPFCLLVICWRFVVCQTYLVQATALHVGRKKRNFMDPKQTGQSVWK